MYKRSEQGWLKHLDFILLDILSLQIALVLAYGLHRGWPYALRRGLAFGLRRGFSRLVYADGNYLTLAAWMAAFSALIAVMFNTMHDVLKRNWATELRQTLTQSLLMFGAVVVLLFSMKDSEIYSRIVLWLTLILYIFFAYALRMTYKRWLLRWRRSDKKRIMLLIADTRSVADAMAKFRSHPVEGIHICGVVLADRDAAGETVEDTPVVANLDGAAAYICREWIDEVCISVTDFGKTPYDLIDKCREMGVTVHLHLMPLSGMGKQAVEKIAGMSVITSSMNFASPIQLLIKRVVDILGGLACSLVALVIIAVVGPMIKKASPGPILYKQERIGQNGRKFRMYKIRSMYMDADARKQELEAQNRVSDGRMFKVDFDPRIIGNETLPDGTHRTGIGEFIRKTSLDEFPQGFNVLLGQMSLVGTRPPTTDEWEKYELHHRARLSTKPGITGMWQVSGRSEITDFEEITRLDTEYIANWSIGLDFRILVKTFGAVLKRKGAM